MFNSFMQDMEMPETLIVKLDNFVEYLIFYLYRTQFMIKFCKEI